MRFKYLNLLFVTLLLSCSTQDAKEEADLILHGGTIYTVNTEQPTVEAVVVKGDKIIFTGNKEEALSYQGDKTVLKDIGNGTVVPGLIEGHAHIMGIGYNLQNVDLMGVKSYEELVESVAKAAENAEPGEWILGRGWHQDKWEEQPESKFKGFPTHHLLSDATPDNPVLLSHASGHLSLANAKAMELAQIDGNTPQPEGGEIFIGIDGKPTGIFNETADLLLEKVVPESTVEKEGQALSLAIEECLKNGVTSLHNAGADQKDIDLFKSFGEAGKLNVRVYTMLNGRNDSLLTSYYSSGPEVGLYNNSLTVRSIKLYADGALGSRGAWLLEPYHDAPGKTGHNVMPMEDIEAVTKDGHKNGFQVCIHAIGDRANREVLDIFEETINTIEGPEDHRFRIEHAQHIALEDIPRFASLKVIPAMQAIHMASDRPWAIDRLGKKRIEDGAYVWKKLLDSGARIVNGSDAPVEPINPIASYYASVARKTLAGLPEEGFEPEQSMTREQALKSYTIDAAYGAFEEDIKGSIEVGKLADFTILSKDILTVPEDEILATQVLGTIVGGKILYEAK